MLSVVIFHGPSAYDQALEKSLTPGFRPIHSPMGGGGLKKEEAQRVVELVSQPPIGDSIGTLVVGPMDLATVASQDSLLKSIEDGRDQHVILILWANDLGEVKSTIRSRCVSIWCPGTPRLDDELLQLAEGVLVALSKKNLFEITLLLEKIKSREAEFLRVLLTLLGEEPQKHLSLWGSLRPLCSAKRLTRIQLITPFAEVCLGVSK